MVVKNLPANAGDKEPRVRTLGQEDPLEEGVAAHSSILAWRIPWTEEPGGLQSMGHKESDMPEQLSTHAHTSQIYDKLLTVNKKKTNDSIIRNG